MRKILPVIILSLLVCACSSIECPINNIPTCGYAVTKSTGKQDTLADTLSIYALRADGSDTCLLNKSVSTKKFSIPMSHTNDEDVLLFYVASRYNDSTMYYYYDTVRVRKTNQAHFESVDCSPNYFHTITDVSWTQNLIENIDLIQQEVTYDSTTNFNIVFKKPY